MHVEVSVALNFVISYLYNKLPRRRVDCLGEELERFLKAKFAGHWYPDQPFKGSAFRCIRVTGEHMDPMMEMASTASGLDIEEVKDYLPNDLTIWIDPHEVSYRIGEKGVVKVLHSEKPEEDTISEISIDHEIQIAGFNPEAQSFQPIETGSPSNWVHSPGSTSPNQIFNRSNAATFTAATFAQTKFGSTKLKSQAKRPSRLSPTELGVYLKQRPWLTSICPQQLSPIGGPLQQDLASPQRELPVLSPQHDLGGLSPQHELAALSPQHDLAGLSPQREQPTLSPQRELSALSPQRELVTINHQRELAALSPKRELAALSTQHDLVNLSPQREFVAVSPQRELTGLSLQREQVISPRREIGPLNNQHDLSLINPNHVSCLGDTLAAFTSPDMLAGPLRDWRERATSPDLDWTCLAYPNLQHLLVAN